MDWYVDIDSCICPTESSQHRSLAHNLYNCVLQSLGDVIIYFCMDYIILQLNPTKSWPILKMKFMLSNSLQVFSINQISGSCISSYSSESWQNSEAGFHAKRWFSFSFQTIDARNIPLVIFPSIKMITGVSSQSLCI